MNEVYRVSSAAHLREFITGFMSGRDWAVLQHNAHRVTYPVNFVALPDCTINTLTIEFLEDTVITLVP